jgi:hypothetical protein
MMKLLGMICGLLIMGGAAAAWHYWHVDGLIALLIAGGGMTLVYNAFGINNE